MRLVFLDRDGVINRFPGKGKYVVKASQFKVMAQALKGIRLLTRAGFALFIISNQGCVSRGLITRRRLDALTRSMLLKVERAGGRIRRVYYCVHQTSDRCDCKKPKTKLMEQAARGLRVSRKDCYFIGDSEEDMRAGKRFGCRTVLALSGRTKKKDLAAFPVKPDRIHKNLLEASRWIIKKAS